MTREEIEARLAAQLHELATDLADLCLEMAKAGWSEWAQRVVNNARRKNEVVAEAINAHLGRKPS